MLSIQDQISASKPFSETNKEELNNMRDKAAGRLRVASDSGTSRLFELTAADKNNARNVDPDL